MKPPAKEFDLAQTESSTILRGNAITHSDNLNAWLYGVKVGSINETRYSVTPDDVQNSILCNNQHFQSITLTRTMSNATGAAHLDNASVISQLTYAISIQNKEAMESNNLRRKEFEKHIEREEKKKDEPRKFTLPSSTCSDVPQPLIKMKRQKKLLKHVLDSSTLKMLDWHSTI